MRLRDATRADLEEFLADLLARRSAATAATRYKVLQDAGITLSSVATDIIGASGRAMLEALVAGTHDPQVLAALAKGRLRTKLPALRAALAGRFRTDHHGLLVARFWVISITWMRPSRAEGSAKWPPC